MTHERLQRCMQAAWDRGDDPFQDEHVLALLDAQPELLEQAARWRQSIAALRGPSVRTAAPTGSTAFAEQTPSGHRPTNRAAARRMVLAAAAAVLGALGALAVWPRSDDSLPATPLANETTSRDAPAPRFLQTRLTRRIEHHGSACSVQQFALETSAVPDAPQDEQRLPILTRIARTERTSLAR